MKYLTSEEITKAKKNISEIKPYKTTKEIIFELSLSSIYSHDT